MKRIEQTDLLISGIVLIIVAIAFILYADDYSFIASVIIATFFGALGIGLFALLNREGN